LAYVIIHLEGADKMQKKTAKIINAIISAVLTLTVLSSECLTAYAADGSAKTPVSKGMTIFIMVAIFIVTALVTGFISFRMRRNKLRRSSEKNSSENIRD
jgi:p-aminobenzoyl-glutamate transporter AbgT